MALTPAQHDLILAYRPFAYRRAWAMWKRLPHQLRRLVGSAEELQQLAVMGLVIAAHRFDPERKADFSAYAKWWVRYQLQTAVTAKLIRGHRFLAETVDAEWEPPAPEYEAPGAEEVAAVRGAVATLPRRLRRVIDLRYRQELSLSQTGRVLGVSKASAQNWERRALHHLRQQLREEQCIA